MDAMTEIETAMETPSEPVGGRDRPSRAETSRRNGRASKGPRSATGKARSAMNATRHGLTAEAAVLALVGETAADWAAHRAGIVAALAPVGALEAELAERVASLTWRLRRVVRAETAALASQLEDAERRGVRDARPLPPGTSALEMELDEDPPTLEELRAEAARLAPRKGAHQRVARARLGADDPDALLDPGDVLVFAQDLAARAFADLGALDLALPELTPGDPVGITRAGWTRWGEVVGLELDGVEVRYPSGDAETVVPWSAHRQDRVSPAEIEVLP